MSSDVGASDLSSQLPGVPPKGRGLRAWVLAFPAVVTLFAAIYSLASTLQARAETPSRASWQAAAEEVRRGWADGDLIVFAPEWLDPLGRQYFGDLMTIEMASRMDASRYKRIWEVSLDGARAKESAGLEVEERHPFGKLAVRRYVQIPVQVSYDFTASLHRAAQSGQMQGRPQLSLEEVGFAPHRCIKVVPRPDQSVSLRFDDVPLGAGIVGYVGLADVFTRRDIREPGRLEVLVNGESAVTVTAGVNDGWERFSAETTPGQGSVEFRVSAIGAGARDRRVCFAAEARR